MVNVRLVEKSLNSKEGRVMEVNLMAKYKIVEMSCKIQRMLRAKRPSHEDGPCASTTSLARVTADERAPPPSIVGNVWMVAEPTAITADEAVEESIADGGFMVLSHKRQLAQPSRLRGQI